MTVSPGTWTKILLVLFVAIAVVLLVAMASGPSAAERDCLAAIEVQGTPEMAATCRAL